MKTPMNEIKQYANAVSEDIFRKPLTKLVRPESVTLRLSLITRLNCNEIDEVIYHQVDEYIKSIPFPDSKIKTPKPKEDNIVVKIIPDNEERFYNDNEE